MPTTSLAGTVQDSKAQRQDRLKSRFRDRGGIFVPSEGNALVDILLARGINGESPSKKRSSRKSALTLRPRASASRTKTLRTGARKRTSRKSAFVPSEGDENYPPSIKKRRNASKTPRLQVSGTTNGMDTSTSAGPSLPRAAAQRKPFANQLADAINFAQTQIVPGSPLLSTKVEPADPAILLGTPPQQDKAESALGTCKAKPAAVLASRYSDESKLSGEEPVSKPTKKSPEFMMLERQRREKHDGQTKGREFTALEDELVNGVGVKSHLLHDLSESSSDSDVPLAKKLAAAKSKFARVLEGTRKKPRTGKEEAFSLTTKKRGRPKAKALPGPAEDPSDKATNVRETVGTGLKKKKKPNVAEEEGAEPETVPLAAPRRRKVAPNADPPPPPTTTHIGVNSSGAGRNVQMLQEKSASASAKVPRKRRERVKASVDKEDKNDDDENEHEHKHEPRQKKRRRVDLTSSRGAKENKELSKLAREAAAKVEKDKPLPSPVKKPARASSKPTSKAKARAKLAKPPPSRAGASATSGTRPRGLPLDVRRRIKIIAQNLPMPDDIDDDDPIDFLR